MPKCHASHTHVKCITCPAGKELTVFLKVFCSEILICYLWWCRIRVGHATFARWKNQQWCICQCQQAQLPCWTHKDWVAWRIDHYDQYNLFNDLQANQDAVKLWNVDKRDCRVRLQIAAWRYYDRATSKLIQMIFVLNYLPNIIIVSLTLTTVQTCTHVAIDVNVVQSSAYHGITWLDLCVSLCLIFPAECCVQVVCLVGGGNICWLPLSGASGELRKCLFQSWNDLQRDTCRWTRRSQAEVGGEGRREGKGFANMWSLPI